MIEHTACYSTNSTEPRNTMPHVKLAACILTTAYRDLVSDKPHLRDKARRFFVQGRYTLWADMARIDYDVVMAGYRNVLAHGLPDGDGRRERYRRP